MRIWRVTRAGLATPTAIGVTLVALALSAEGLARTEWASANLRAPSVGTRSRAFDDHLHGLERFAAGNPVDCLVGGNSLVQEGIDPWALASGYARASGGRLRCYNFGIGGTTLRDVAEPLAVVAEMHRSWLIVVGISIADFDPTANRPHLEEAPWVRYRRGAWDSDGWLADHSRGFEYFLAYRLELRPAMLGVQMSATPMRDDGFVSQQHRIGDDTRALENARATAAMRADAVSTAGGIHTQLELDALRGDGRILVVVEMPTHPVIAASLLADTAYQDFRRELRDQVTAGGGLLLEPMSAGIVVEAPYFADPWHMNADGAVVLGRWIGEQIGAAMQAGVLAAPAPLSVKPSP